MLCVVGARPNLMKMAPVVEELRRAAELHPVLIHTGQHYDHLLSGVFFEQLGLPEPEYHLGVGSASHARQVGRVMVGLEPIIAELRPAAVVVAGDVNSTLGAALVAAKATVPLAHVEAGLRSFDRGMPEELNRVLVDAISDLLFTTEPSADANLRREGVPADRIHRVGNTMIDTLLRHRQRAAALDVPGRLGLEPGGYAVATLHRPSNVDDDGALRAMADLLRFVQGRLPVVFPAHPRTAARLTELGLAAELTADGVRLPGPMSYLEFLGAMDAARLVLTDSGGVQEETTILGVPCLTLRDTTERPVTVGEGTNRVVGTRPEAVRAAVLDALEAPVPEARRPELWDGSAAARIVSVLRVHLLDGPTDGG